MGIITKEQVINLISRTTEECLLNINKEIDSVMKQLDEAVKTDEGINYLSTLKAVEKDLESLRLKSSAISDFDTKLKIKVINFFK